MKKQKEYHNFLFFIIIIISEANTCRRSSFDRRAVPMSLSNIRDGKKKINKADEKLSACVRVRVCVLFVYLPSSIIFSFQLHFDLLLYFRASSIVFIFSSLFFHENKDVKLKTLHQLLKTRVAEN